MLTGAYSLHTLSNLHTTTTTTHQLCFDVEFLFLSLCILSKLILGYSSRCVDLLPYWLLQHNTVAGFIAHNHV